MSRRSSRPKVLKDLTIYVDVDDTLCLWDLPQGYTGPTIAVNALNTYHAYPVGGMIVRRRLAVNVEMVEILKCHKRSGGNVIVWSQGGVVWASEVVHKLGLDRFVDLIVDKPTIIFDDLPPSMWMPAPKHVLPEGWESVHSHLNLEEDDDGQQS